MDLDWPWLADDFSTHNKQSKELPGPTNSFDEEKCRNVLVRYCAHIPRNYQYRDGIQKVGPLLHYPPAGRLGRTSFLPVPAFRKLNAEQIEQIFLALREHLGDEKLDFAGGVLYELIEVDCQYSDDPGAAFQRWKHDHMNRHNDLELPHIPHMTTITPVIRPTRSLIRWRQSHPERYSIRLSDSAPSADYSSSEPNGIHCRKTWIIDHTIYVSTRDGGTRPFKSISAQEFHELQWNIGLFQKGRLVEERAVLPVSVSSENNLSDFQPPQRKAFGVAPPQVVSCHTDRSPKSWSPASDPQNGNGPVKRSSRFLHMLGLNPVVSLREFLDSRSIPLPDGCRVPNAIFARKFGLVLEGSPLPPSLSYFSMPTAESKATKDLTEAADRGLLFSSWIFKGPFTPQLGFDGGLDFKRTGSMLSDQNLPRDFSVLQPTAYQDCHRESAAGAHEGFNLSRLHAPRGGNGHLSSHRSLAATQTSECPRLELAFDATAGGLDPFFHPRIKKTIVSAL